MLKKLRSITEKIFIAIGLTSLTALAQAASEIIAQRQKYYPIMVKSEKNNFSSCLDSILISLISLISLIRAL